MFDLTMMQHGPGLAASLPARNILKIDRDATLGEFRRWMRRARVLSCQRRTVNKVTCMPSGA